MCVYALIVWLLLLFLLLLQSLAEAALQRTPEISLSVDLGIILHWTDEVC